MREHRINDFLDGMEMVIELMAGIRTEPNAAIRKFYYDGLVRLSEEMGLEPVPPMQNFLNSKPEQVEGNTIKPAGGDHAPS